jgi:hypothetical protein
LRVLTLAKTSRGSFLRAENWPGLEIRTQLTDRAEPTVNRPGSARQFTELNYSHYSNGRLQLGLGIRLLSNPLKWIAMDTRYYIHYGRSATYPHNVYEKYMYTPYTCMSL